MENKIDNKKLEELLNSVEFKKALDEKAKSGEISLDDMEGVAGGWTTQEVKALVLSDPKKYSALIPFFPELRGIVPSSGSNRF